MKVIPTKISGLVIVETSKNIDNRGEFFRAFCQSELATVIGDRRIIQINISKTSAIGAVRGMHFQRPPQAEMKLIRCIKGKIWDVAVDLRADSPTYKQWHAEELSATTAKMIVIPEGCAHGFQVLEKDSELLYLHTAPYSPELEGGIQHNDPAIKVQWPLEITEISDRDRQHPIIGPDFQGILL